MKLTRRGLFGMIGAALVAPYVPLPAPRYVGHPSAMFAFPPYPVIPMRKLMARIRITEECMNDSSSGAFMEACRNAQWRTHEDIARRLSDSDYGV